MKNTDFKIPEYVRFALERMRANGHEIFLVGGCVRDMIMKKIPNDYDLTTDALPQRTAECFPELHVINTGQKHGTVTVVVDHRPIEITTYRKDGEYDDNRHPRAVTFTPNIKDDLARRDFTVNAMAYSDREGLIDLFGGQADIESRTVRCVGDPDTRFAEDGLRIMRALRFCATLGFFAEKETAAAVHRNRELLKNISAERLREEFLKLICGENASAVIREYYDVIGVFIPEILPCVGFDQNTVYHDLDVLEHTLCVMDGCDSEDTVLRLAAFFHDIGKPECYTEDERGGHFVGHAAKSAELADRVMSRLKFDNATKKKVRRLVAEHCAPVEPTERSVRRFMSDHSDEDAARAIALERADRLACAPKFRDTGYIAEIERIMKELRAREARISLATLQIRGDDLIRLGFFGKEIGECLELLLSRVLDGELPNEKAVLIEEAEKIKGKKC